MRRSLVGGYELDDDPGRVDWAAVHRFLCEESYWARGRSRELQDTAIDGAAGVAGLCAANRSTSRAQRFSRFHRLLNAAIPIRR